MRVNMLTKKEALAIYNAGPEIVVQVLCSFSRQIDLLEQRVKKLEDQLAKNSRNSSKPPSTDGFNKPKPKSLRKKSGKKSGGQKGHSGTTRCQINNPDEIIAYPLNKCNCCGKSLTATIPDHIEKRQIWDIPPIEILVTEHQVLTKTCSNCKTVCKSSFPDDVNAPVQFGPQFKSFILYLREYQLIPYKRTCELVETLFGIKISEGTVDNIISECHNLVENSCEEIKRQLKVAPVVNFDETGAQVIGEKKQWVHVSSNSFLTYYRIHNSRGSEALDSIGILPGFEGHAVHDFWRTYLKYECLHSLCNAHHLRELTFVNEQHKQKWAKEMIDCLIHIKISVDYEKMVENKQLCQSKILDFEKWYQKIIEQGYLENPILKQGSPKKKRGRKKKTKSRNLLERLDEHRNKVLAFMYDFNVPFDNNQAERDLRMIKVQQKISGCFRNFFAAKRFFRIRSYISTAKKNDINVIKAISDAFLHNPFVPQLNSS